MGAPPRTTTLARRGAPRRGRPGRLAPQLLAFPIAAGVLVLVAPGSVDLALAAILAVGFVAVVARSPVPALLAFPPLLTFQQVLLAAAFHAGLPAGIVRGLGFWKESLMAGLVVAAILKMRETGARLDPIDVVALAFVWNSAVYRALPGLFTVGGVVPSSSTLNLAFRGSALLVVVFVAGRHLQVGAEVRDRFARVVLATGGVVAAIGIVESIFSSWWNSFAIDVLGIVSYRSTVLNAVIHDPNDIRVHADVAGRSVVRIGSVLFSQIYCALLLVVALAIAVEHLSRERRPRWVAPVVPLLGTAILLTQTRAAIAAAGVVLLLALRPAPGRDPRARERVGLAIAGSVVLLLPFVVSSGIAARTIESITASDRSTQEHGNRTGAALGQLAAHPLGSGLGTTSEVSRRVGADVSGAAENYYLDVGNETGVQSLALIVALTACIAVVLQRRTRSPDGEPVHGAWRGAMVALALAGLLHPVWFDPVLAWPFWLGAGLAVGPPSTVSALVRTVP